LAGVVPKFVELTNDVVSDDLRRRPDLTLRDRSLVTIAALAAIGEQRPARFLPAPRTREITWTKPHSSRCTVHEP
jgi:alkylhydroperoxidase/carboxymuconolactone decarboxylase family protein YurZ